LALMEKVVHQLRRRGVEARRLFQASEAGAGDVLGRAERIEQRALARRADAGDFVDHGS
jgi:hypothetical protein